MINTSIGLIGVARQSAKGTPASAPTFKHGLTGGGLVNPERTIENKGVACGVRADMASGAYVNEVNIGVDFETLAYADALGLYLLSVLGNVATTAVSGKTGYYQHVFTLGSALPYLTFWGQVGDTSQETVQRVSDSKVDTLALDFEGNAPVNIGITAAGMAAALFGEWDDSVDPSCFSGFFVPTNGTFKIETLGNSPAVAPITKGSIELSNNLSASRTAGQALASALSEGKLTASASVTVVPDDFALLRKMVTGSASGTSVSSSIVKGSFEWTFTHTDDEDFSLKVAASNVPFTASFPEVNPDGNAAEVEFSADGIGVASASGSPVTITLINKVASYTN